MRIIREILDAIRIFSEPSDEDVHTRNEKEKTRKRARSLMYEEVRDKLKTTQLSLKNEMD